MSVVSDQADCYRSDVLNINCGDIAVWSQLSGEAFVENNPEKDAVMRLTLQVLLLEDLEAPSTIT